MSLSQGVFVAPWKIELREARLCSAVAEQPLPPAAPPEGLRVFRELHRTIVGANAKMPFLWQWSSDVSLRRR